MVPRHIGTEHEFDRRDLECGDLGGDRFRVIEYMVSAIPTTPFPLLLFVE